MIQRDNAQTEVVEKSNKPDTMKILMVVGAVAVVGFLAYKFMPKLFSEMKPSK